jgi:predicted sulfurtransferase
LRGHDDITHYRAMPRFPTFLLVVCLVATAGAALAQGPVADPTRISMDEFKKLHAQDRVLVVDVRAADAYVAGHIPGARSMPLATLADPAVVASLKGTTKPIVTYCA